MFMSKVIEKGASCQVTSHIDSNGLGEYYQSSFKKFHSTETALLMVKSDFLQYIDNNKPVLLVLLDMSAAFGTINHPILLQRLRDRFGLRESVVSWFRSYFENRTMRVSCLMNMYSTTLSLMARSSAHKVLFYIQVKLGISSVVTIFVFIVTLMIFSFTLPSIIRYPVIVSRLWNVLPCAFLT